ncbi:MAG: tRNA (adenosine(37)-N6)-threonylcarbamoyltransferase complex ATPase subunit type 1 TsaE [Bacilli bacterium]|nr:tRNA (adenosine(37)-N6)-threonylcarbamoyltransferase complex ATPase subunit type 1 TsaE [Bacilli bacterium]
MDLEYKITSKSEADTIVLAQNIESEKFNGMVICLNGELGTGKTVFTKGFADALEIDEVVTSPTFSIIKEYLSGQMPLYHMDMYRLEGNIKSTGILDYFDRDGIVIIEWADMIKDYLPEERLDIYFKAIDEDTRVIKLIPYGTKYEELCEDILS